MIKIEKGDFMKSIKFTTRDITITGLLTAINFIVITFFNVPFGAGAMVHLGSVILFSSSIAFGGIKGGISGSLGATISDLTTSYVFYAPFTLVIKFLTGYFIGSISNNSRYHFKSKTIVYIFACVIGSSITIVGYLIAWTFILGSFEIAITKVPSSLFTSLIGTILGIPLGITLKKVLPNITD